MLQLAEVRLKHVGGLAHHLRWGGLVGYRSQMTSEIQVVDGGSTPNLDLQFKTGKNTVKIVKKCLYCVILQIWMIWKVFNIRPDVRSNDYLVITWCFGILGIPPIQNSFSTGKSIKNFQLRKDLPNGKCIRTIRSCQTGNATGNTCLESRSAGIDPLQHFGETDLGGKSRQRFWPGNVPWDLKLRGYRGIRGLKLLLVIDVKIHSDFWG